MALLRTLFWLGWMFVYMLGCIPKRVLLRRYRRQGNEAARDALVTREVGKWADKLLRHTRIEVEVRGAEHLPAPGQTVVYAANHQSYLDIPVLLARLKPTPPLMAKAALGKIPLLSGWMKELGCIFVDTKDTRAGVAALKAAEAEVVAGKCMVIFPEGTRSRSDALGEFKGGAMRIALKAGVPIVPVAISGTWRGLEGNNFRLQPAKVCMTVLPAVPTEGLSRQEQKEMPKQLEEMIRAANAECLVNRP